MTREELIKILDILPEYRWPSKLLDQLAAAQLADNCETLSEFIRKKLAETSVSVVSNQQQSSDTLRPLLEDMHNSGFQFEGAYDPGMLREFVSESGGLWNRRLSDLSDKQTSTFRLARKLYREWCTKTGRQFRAG